MIKIGPLRGKRSGKNTKQNIEKDRNNLLSKIQWEIALHIHVCRCLNVQSFNSSPLETSLKIELRQIYRERVRKTRH